jgi:hypothetical protein
MEEQCKNVILSYCNEDMQRNAILLGEHEDYVKLCLKIIRDQYRRDTEAGLTNFILSDEATTFLDSIKPWEEADV